jgi:hypothetical protein
MAKEQEHLQIEVAEKYEKSGYAYESAIAEATRLWNELRQHQIQRGWKYPMRERAFEHLLSAWKDNPGKAIVHLADLADFIHMKLDDEGVQILKEEWSKLVAKETFRKAFTENGGLYGVIRGKHQTVSVGALRAVDPDVFLRLEQHVLSLRPGANGKELAIRIPFRIDTDPFARLFGYFGGLITKKASHLTRDREVHDDFVKTIQSAIGGIDKVVQERGDYSRTHTTTFIQHIFAIGGITIGTRQAVTDNPSPLFLFAVSDSVVQEYLKRLFESEGGPDYNKEREITIGVDLHQAVVRDVGSERDRIPPHPRRISFRELSNQQQLLDKPPRLLVSASLLLLRLGIESRFYPADLYMNDAGETVMRWRLMITGVDIDRFAEQIGFISKEKQQRLEARPKP